MIFCVASVLAFSVEKVDKGSVIIAELQNPAMYDFSITTGSSAGSAELYSLVGVEFSPKGAFDLPTGTKTIEVRAYPSDEYLAHPGNYIIEYYLRGNDPLYKDTLSFRVTSLKDTLSISPSNLRHDDLFLNLTITNVENTNIDNAELTFESEFFTTSKKISLKPFESISLSLPIDKSKSSKLTAGKYVLTAKIALEDAKVKSEGIINYLEQQGTSITKNTEGFLVRKTTIVKKNEGNTVIQDSITLSKNIISRLFTLSSSTPSTTRSGFVTEYIWTKQLMPGDSWQVTSTTNYTWPFLFIILIVIVAFLAKIYSTTNLSLTKNVSYVKTKGGQFALKVSIHVKARKHVDHIQLIDRLPGMTKLYEKFGIKPDKIENESRRIFWNIERLQAGEERVYSYIIYSTVAVVGRFELPSATAIYEKDGKTFESFSNRAFFISETNLRN